MRLPLITTVLALSLALASSAAASQLPAPRLEVAPLRGGLELRVDNPGREPLWLLLDRRRGPARVGSIALGVGLSEDLRVLPLGGRGRAHLTRMLPASLLQGGGWYLQAIAPATLATSGTWRVGGAAQSGGGLLGNWGGPSRLLFVDGTSGVDGGPGTPGAPWRTIQYAADHAPAGSTVVIAAGIYPERVVVGVSGNASEGPITFSGDPAGGTILDGSGFGGSDFATWSGAFGLGLLDVTDHSWLRFEHLEIRGLETTSPNYFLMGVVVSKTDQNTTPVEHVEFFDLDVHDIRYVGGNNNGGAQGIAFYGGHTGVPIRDVEVVESEIHHLRLGQSESMTFNGNIEGFYVARCLVHDNDNIGISIIGWEGTAGGSWSDDSSDGNADQYGGHDPNDRARAGLVQDNWVWACSTETPVKNTTYPPHDYSAGGIYVDGGKDCVIQRNFVYECDLGIEIGCEHAGVDDNGVPRDVSDITCRNNVVYYCGQAGIGLGGYNKFRGVAIACEVLNNTVYKCSSLGWGGGQVLVGKSHDNRIAGNILYARGSADVDDYDGYNNSGQDWSYDHGVVLGSSVGAANNYGNELDSNLYFTEDGIANIYWKWEMGDNKDPKQGWSGLAAIDANGLFGDPLFINATLGRANGSEDFRLSDAASPAVDSGDGTLDVGHLDGWHYLRVAGPSVDRGAHEWGSLPSH